MRNSPSEIKDAEIRLALRNAESKGQMGVVAAITGISKQHLSEIMVGEFDIPHRQRIVLSAHIN